MQTWYLTRNTLKLQQNFFIVSIVYVVTYISFCVVLCVVCCNRNRMICGPNIHYPCIRDRTPKIPPRGMPLERYNIFFLNWTLFNIDVHRCIGTGKLMGVVSWCWIVDQERRKLGFEGLPTD